MVDWLLCIITIALTIDKVNLNYRQFAYILPTPFLLFNLGLLPIYIEVGACLQYPMYTFLNLEMLPLTIYPYMGTLEVYICNIFVYPD